MSSVVPHAGSVFAYAREGLGGAAGFLAGWLAMLDYLLIPAVACLFSGIASRAAIGPWLAVLLAVTKAVGPAFAAMTGQAAAGRLLYGVARDGRLPASLAAVDARHGVPRASLLTVAALTFAVSLWAARRDDGLDVLVSIVDVGALAAFTLLHASVVGYFVVRQRAEARAMHWIVPALGAVATLWVLVEASTLAKVVGGTWSAIGLVLALVGRQEGGAPGTGAPHAPVD